jgi:hypothetical protein
MNKIVYQYDPETGAFLGEYSAQASPAEPEIKDENGVVIQEQAWIVPTFSTAIAPPTPGANQIPVFHSELQAWRFDPDFRGQTWFNANTGQSTEITEIGQPDPSLVPVLPDAIALQQAKEKKISDLRMACFNAITAGFTSSASGAAMSYGYSLTDQHNLNAAAAASLSPVIPPTWTLPIWCANSGGTWAMLSHTAEQIQALNADAIAHRAGYSAKMAGLVPNVISAQTVADVDSITW